MTEPKKLTLIIGDKGYSSQGYFYIGIGRAYNYDIVEIRGGKSKTPIAGFVAWWFKLNGWQEHEKGWHQEQYKRWKCIKCGKQYPESRKTCLCGSECQPRTYLDMVLCLERIGALEARREEILKSEESKKYLALLENHNKIQSIHDEIILKRWTK